MLPCLRILGLLLLCSSRVDAVWPFDSKQEPDTGHGQMHHMHEFGQMPMGAHFAFGGAPVVVVEQHMGFNPWEDLHRNMEQVLRQQGAGSGGQLALPQPAPIAAQLGGLLSMFGDQHAGQIGLAQGSFKVDDDHQTRVLISAELPGYQLRGEHPDSERPLSVRAIGRRSVVVTGTRTQGIATFQWQRSFSLPKGCDMAGISVTYNSGNGNLTVMVPRKNATDAEDSSQQEEDSDELDALLPPPLQAMRAGLPGIVGRMQGSQVQRPAGFLRPAPMSLEDILADVMGQLAPMHPRYHGPGVDKPVPEDAQVNLIGCFAESQMDKVHLKYYGGGNAASFADMYWHAVNDHVPFLAMSRHSAPLGHAFTAEGFLHEHEVPKYGVYEDCGAPCEDDDARWCGCANEPARGFENPLCADEEKRFAVYKIGLAATPPEPTGGPSPPEAEGAAGSETANSSRSEQLASQGSAASPPVAQPEVGRPQWQLSNDQEGAPSIEISVPKGTFAEAKGNKVLLFNATESTAAPQAADQPGQDASAAEGAALPSVGQVNLPVGVSPDSCKYGQTDKGQVLKCKLEKEDVRELPIKVIDEL